MAAFDVQRALADGHSPSEIADYLGKQIGFDSAKARADGHSDADILKYVVQKHNDIIDTHLGRLQNAQNALSAETNAHAPLSVTDKALAGADLGTAALSKLLVGGVGGGAAGLLARATLQDPEAAKRWVDENLVYHPQTQTGQDVAASLEQGLADTARPVTEGLAAADKAIPVPASRLLGQALGTAGDIGSVLGGGQATGGLVRALQASRSGLARGAEAAGSAINDVVNPAPTAIAQTPLDVMEASGHRVLPSTVQNGTGVGAQPSLLARTLEKIAGSRGSATSFIKSNLANDNDLAAQGIGLPPNTLLNDAAIAQAKKPFADVYNTMRETVPPAPLGDTTVARMQAAGRGTSSKLELPPSIQAIKDGLTAGGEPWSTSEVLDTMSDLRNRATKDLMSADSEVVARGNAYMEMAKALEDHLDEQLTSRPSLVSPQDFRAARTGFAKIFTVDAARTGHDVDPQAIAKLGRETRIANGKSVNTGELAIIENNATFSPNESQGRVPLASDFNPSGSPEGNVLRGALDLARVPARKLLSATRGVDERATPFRERPALANFFPVDNPSTIKPDLKLTPPPGPVIEPHQPWLPELGDMSSPMAESTQNPRRTLALQPPPGPVIQPRQRDLDLGQGDDYLHTASPTIDELLAAIAGRRNGGL